jgi:hypothetical protein
MGGRETAPEGQMPLGGAICLQTLKSVGGVETPRLSHHPVSLWVLLIETVCEALLSFLEARISTCD